MNEIQALENYRICSQKEKEGMRKFNVDKDELRYEILLYNYKNNDNFEDFTRILLEYQHYVMSKIEESNDSSLSNINELVYYNHILNYLNVQCFSKYVFAHLSHLILDICQNYIRRANFFGYTEDWKNDMIDFAYDNCCKYLKNYKETFVSKNSKTGVSSAFSYVTQILHTSFITIIKKKNASLLKSDDFDSNTTLMNAQQKTELHILLISTQQTLFKKFIFFIQKTYENYKKLKVFVHFLDETDEVNLETALTMLKDFNSVELENYNEEDISEIEYVFFQDTIIDNLGNQYYYGSHPFEFLINNKRVIDIASEQLKKDVEKNPQNFHYAVDFSDMNYFRGDIAQIFKYIRDGNDKKEYSRVFGEKLGFRNRYLLEYPINNRCFYGMTDEFKTYFSENIAKNFDKRRNDLKEYLDDKLVMMLAFVYWDNQKFYRIEQIIRAYELYIRNKFKKPFIEFYRWFVNKWDKAYGDYHYYDAIESKIIQSEEYQNLLKVWGEPTIDEEMVYACEKVFKNKQPYNLDIDYRDYPRETLTLKQMAKTLKG